MNDLSDSEKAIMKSTARLPWTKSNKSVFVLKYYKWPQSLKLGCKKMKPVERIQHSAMTLAIPLSGARIGHLFTNALCS